MISLLAAYSYLAMPLGEGAIHDKWQSAFAGNYGDAMTISSWEKPTRAEYQIEKDIMDSVLEAYIRCRQGRRDWDDTTLKIDRILRGSYGRVD